MIGLVIAEAVAIALLALLVAGLLRSHARDPAALHALGAGQQPEQGPTFRRLLRARPRSSASWISRRTRGNRPAAFDR